MRVVVDYAHTDDALKNLLETARPLAVGPRDHGVRMRRRSRQDETAADGRGRGPTERRVVVTSDNPRSENPDQIIEEIKRGIVLPADRVGPADSAPKGPQCLSIPDRKLAIERAVKDARPGDLVLIAGKGHEKYQEIGDRTLPFDDVEVARGALAQRRGSRVS